MAWQQISPQFVRQDDPRLQAAWYRDTAPRGGGELMVWLDPQDRIVAFQLSHEEWPSMRHYVAEWHAGAAARIGHVDEGEPTRRPRMRPAPLMRFGTGRNPDAADRLLRYFYDNAASLRPQHRQVISSVLGEAAA